MGTNYISSTGMSVLWRVWYVGDYLLLVCLFASIDPFSNCCPLFHLIWLIHYLLFCQVRSTLCRTTSVSRWLHLTCQKCKLLSVNLGFKFSSGCQCAAGLKWIKDGCAVRSLLCIHLWLWHWHLVPASVCLHISKHKRWKNTESHEETACHTMKSQLCVWATLHCFQALYVKYWALFNSQHCSTSKTLNGLWQPWCLGANRSQDSVKVQWEQKQGVQKHTESLWTMWLT